MNILILTASYLPRKGGVESFCSDLANLFKEKGNKVIVATKKYPRYLPSKEKIKNIEVWRYIFFDPKKPDNTLRSYMAFIYTLLLSPFQFFKFAVKINSFKPKIIYYHFIGSPSFFLLLYKFLFKVDVIACLHGDDVKTLAVRSRTGKRLFCGVVKKAKAVVANSFYTLEKAKIIEPSISAGNKGRVIYNGIDVNRFCQSEKYRNSRKYALCVSRMVEKKGLDVLIEAFALIATSLPDLDLFIVGDGPENEKLHNLADKNKLNKRISFFGETKKELVAQLIKGCECLIVPSRDEPFGIVILEAMACKKVVVATRSGGPEEIIDNYVNGLLVEKGNPHDLAEAIQKIENDIQLRNNIIKKLDTFDSQFDIENVADKYLYLSQI